MNPKQALWAVAKASGVMERVASSAWRQRRLLILCYHGISLRDEHEWDPGLFMPPAQFRERLRLLRRERYNVLPLGEALQRLHAGTLPPRAVAITFDDGTQDFAVRAVPALVEFDIPATVYLTTYYCEHPYPIFDTALGYLLWQGRDSGADVAPLLEHATPLPVRSEAERQHVRAVVRAHTVARGLDAAAKDALLQRIAAAVGADYAGMVQARIHHVMTPETVRALPRPLVDVQLHTHRHRSPDDREAFAREIVDNRAAIDRLVGGGSGAHFCYPSGEYLGRQVRWLRELGVQSATTCVPGITTPDTEPMLLPRFVDTTLQSALAFEAWVSGLAALLPRRRTFRFDAQRLEGQAVRDASYAEVG